jgi:hypothetical protein
VRVRLENASAQQERGPQRWPTTPRRRVDQPETHHRPQHTAGSKSPPSPVLASEWSMCRLVFILISACVGLSSKWAPHATLPSSILLRAEDAGLSDNGCVEARPSCALLRLQLSPESTHRGTFREKFFEVSCVNRVRSSGWRGSGPAHASATRLSQPLPTLRQQARGTAEPPIYELLELIQTVDARALMGSALLIKLSSPRRTL